MANNKMTTCTHCGKEIAANAKTCPNCGAKVKKPIYKRVWFWILVAILVLGIGGSAGGAGGSGSSNGSNNTSADSSTEVQEEAIEYTAVTTDELSDALDNNPAAASDTYKGKYWEVTGRLSNIDSDCNYISLVDIDDEWNFVNIQCYTKNEEQKNIVKQLSMDQTLTVKGKITDVGEVIGYQMDIDEIIVD